MSRVKNSNLSNYIPNLKKLIKEQFGLIPIQIKQLWGYDNTNYLIMTKGSKFIFKTYANNSDTFDLLQAENKAFEHVKSEKNLFPVPVKYKDDSLVKILKIAGKERICRMLTFLNGELLGDVKPSKELFSSLGKTTAELDVKLQSFNNKSIKARRWKWDLQYLSLNKKYIKDIPDVKNRSLVEYYFEQYDENVIPLFPELRKSIIHGDVNEWNVLVKNDSVTGIIDFGDLCYSPLINELAITIAYACLYVDDPLKMAEVIVNSFNKVLLLKEEELSILYYLIPARLCVSVCNSAHERLKNPNNTYTAISEKLAWQFLNNWLKINPIALENSFRKNCGFKIIKPKSIKKVIADRYKVISPILSVSYDDPIYVTKSAFQYMYDAYGNTYLDAYNNIPHVGHSHPKVVEAGQRQMAKLNTNTRYIYDILNEYSEKLLSKFPSKLNTVYFVNSGSAASDLAIRMAKTHTGFDNIMVMEHGYHGNTQITIDISDYKFNNKLGHGQKDYIIKPEIPDIYRGKYKGENAGKQFAQDSIKVINSLDKQIAAFISEPILGCAGQVQLADGYLTELYPAIRKHGGVCISDEVQTGFGRLGKYFWGFEAQNVVPDIVIIGKPMGNGHPMGAVVTTQSIAGSFSKGVEFFSSFGGNPVSCTIGLAVLEVIEEENLQENARIVGNYYYSLLKELQKDHNKIGNIRGNGLFIGIELVKDRNNSQPATNLAKFVKNEFRNRNILLSTDGPFKNVIKSKPPLCFNKDNVEQVVETLNNILQSK